MPPGSVLIFHGSLWHCGGANRVNHWRMGVDGTYLLGWLRPQTAQETAYPPAFAKTLPSQLARLIGYQTHQPYLGQVHAEHDLYAVLEDEDATPGELPKKGIFEKKYPNYGVTLVDRPRLSLRDTK
jgi:ectoine hydroxylase-related dioxygenase (phytanoyl-CoA dioxygenase family)